MSCGIHEAAWLQAGLLSNSGGMGVRHGKDTAHAAFMGSALASVPLVCKLSDRHVAHLPSFQGVVEVYLEQLDATAKEKAEPYLHLYSGDELSSDVVSSLNRRTQSFFQKFLDDRRRQCLAATLCRCGGWRRFTGHMLEHGWLHFLARH